MSNWTITFLVMAVLTAILGFGEIVGELAATMKLLSWVFFGLLIATALPNLDRHNR